MSNFFIVLILVIGQENVFHGILRRKNALLDYKNIKLKKSKNWDLVLVKNWQFSHLYSLGKIGQENVFYNILERKTPV